MRSLFYPLEQADAETVHWQLKSDAIRVGGIIERCVYGYPSIVLLDPRMNFDGPFDPMRQNKKSFFTLLWITCPFLVDRILELESAGYVEKIRDLLKNERIFINTMSHAYANFYFFSKTMHKHFKVDDQIGQKITLMLDEYIDYFKDSSNIACLHMHYAHFRFCPSNIAGKITYLLLNKKIHCDERTCENAFQKK